MRSKRAAWLLALGVALISVACGASAASARTTGTNPRSAQAQPTRAKPSKTARMICSRGLRSELAGVLATKPTRVSSPTWSDHLYSCDFVYRQGTVTLSVKELHDSADTTAYFDGVGQALGRRPGDVHLGDAAYQTTNGSMVVRKDDKVLLVDVTKLPPDGFAKPGYTSEDIASAIAVTILGCWN
jgi:hypothetical protein